MKVVTDTGTIDLGTTQTTATVGITDYSLRTTDDFGVTTVVERGFSRTLQTRVLIPTGETDAVQQQLAALRATTPQWIADDRFAWLNFAGFFKDFTIDLSLHPIDYCTLTIEGLTETETVADTGGDPAPIGAVSTLQVLQPVIMTDQVLVADSVAENDAAVWNAATVYPMGAYAMRVGTHRVYESAISGNVGNTPETSPADWLDLGPTNRWAMFDQALGTSTVAASPIVVTLNAGANHAVALLDVTGDTVRVQTNGYDRTVPVGQGAITFLDLPATNGQVTVTISGGGQVAVGTLLIGTLAALGITEASPTAGITDYSRKDVDAFGEATIVPRAWSKQMSAKALIRTDALDIVANRVASVRAQPCLWLGQVGTDALTVYGFWKDFSIVVSETTAMLSLTIEGLSTAPKIAPFTIDWENVGNLAGLKPANGATVGATAGTNLYDGTGGTLSTGDIKTSVGTSKDTSNVAGVGSATLIGQVGQVSGVVNNVTPPDVPTNLAVTSALALDINGLQVVTLQALWTGSTAPLTAGYILALSQNGGTYLPIDVGLVTSYATTIPATTAVNAKILAYDRNANRSAYSGIVSYTATKDTAAPGFTSGLTATSVGLSSISVSWTNPADGDVLTAIVYEGPTNDFATAVAIGTVNAKPGQVSSATFTRATGSSKYYWAVAVDSSGNKGPAGSSALGTVASVSNVNLTPGLVAPSTVATLPSAGGYTGPALVFNQADGKLYRYTGGAFTAAVAGTDVAAGSLPSTALLSPSLAAITGAQPIQNSLVTIDGSGKLQGIGTGVGSAVANTLLSLSSTGTLAGGGGGSITSLPGTSIAAGTITGGQIAGGTITGSLIAANTIVANNIQVGAITTNALYVGASTEGLVGNGGFESGTLDGWYDNTGTTTIVAGNNGNGSGARIAFSNGGGVFSKAFPVTPGKTYTFSFAGRGSGGSATGVYFRVCGGPTKPAFSQGASPYFSDLLSNSILPVGWQTLTYSWTAPANVSWASLAFYNTGTTYPIVVDDVQAFEQVAGTRIQSGTITTANIAAGTITSNNIAANTIVGGNIAAGTITANNVLAGTLTAAQVATGSLTSDRLAVGVKGANMLTNPGAEEGTAGWQFVPSVGSCTFTSSTSQPKTSGSSSFVLAKDATSSSMGVLSRAMPVTPGKTYVVRAQMLQGSGNAGYYLRVYSSATSSSTGYIPNPDSGTIFAVTSTSGGNYENFGLVGFGFNVIEGTWTCPAGMYWASVYVLNYTNGSTTLIVDDFEFYQQATTVSIADGSITASKIVVGSITADRIQAGTLTGDRFSTGTSLPGTITVGSTGVQIGTVASASAKDTSASNVNAAFSDWPVGQTLPTYLGQAANAQLYMSRAAGVVGLNGLRYNVPAGSGVEIFGVFDGGTANGNGGAIGGFDPGLTGMPAGFYRCEVDVTLNSGTLKGSGAYFAMYGTGANASPSINFATQPDSTGAVLGDGVPGTRYRWSVLFDYRGIGGPATARMHPMALWSGFGYGNSNAKDITFNRIAMVPASSVDIDPAARINAFTTTVNGGQITTGSIQAIKLAVTSLDAITANIGTLRTATTGLRTEITNNGMRTYDGTNSLPAFEAGVLS